MYKIETHLHTKYSSGCGWLEAKEILAGYAAAGYSGIVVTDHYNRYTYAMKGIDPAAQCDRVTPFLEGYHRMKEEGERHGIRIYKGAELRFDGSDNDYLLYGYHNRLLEDPQAIFTMGLAAFSPLYRESGALLIQAHPFRDNCSPADPSLIDGIEVINMHPEHNSRNHLAKQYAQRFGLLETSGSDCHQLHHMARGGILSETLPQDDFQMAQLLRSGNFQLIGK